MQPGTNILIAEDDPNSARLISDYLTAKGALTAWKNNGSEALEAVQASHYDLLILDLRLPEKNGFVVARKIRNLLIVGNAAQFVDRPRATRGIGSASQYAEVL